MRLKKAAGELRQQAQISRAHQVNSFEARLLLDRDHQQAVQLVAGMAKQSLYVATNDLVAASRPGLLRIAATASERLGAKDK